MNAKKKSNAHSNSLSLRTEGEIQTEGGGRSGQNRKVPELSRLVGQQPELSSRPNSSFQIRTTWINAPAASSALKISVRVEGEDGEGQSTEPGRGRRVLFETHSVPIFVGPIADCCKGGRTKEISVTIKTLLVVGCVAKTNISLLSVDITSNEVGGCRVRSFNNVVSAQEDTEGTIRTFTRGIKKS